MTNPITEEAVEAAAKAMSDDWNPGRDPVLTAMFRDYAMSALTAAAPLIAAQATADLRARIEALTAVADEARSVDALLPSPSNINAKHCEQLASAMVRLGIALDALDALIGGA